MTEAADRWEDLEPSSYQADGQTRILFIARMIGEDGGIRAVRHTRPFQDGWKQDSTGADGDVFSIECLFHPDVTEEDTDRGQLPIWPDRLEALIKQFKLGKT